MKKILLLSLLTISLTTKAGQEQKNDCVPEKLLIAAGALCAGGSAYELFRNALSPRLSPAERQEHINGLIVGGIFVALGTFNLLSKSSNKLYE